MGDLSRESNGATWPSGYTDARLPNGQHFNGALPTTIADSLPGYQRDVLKQTMLRHEAIFKDQVYELHRLHQVQRDLDEARRKEQLKRRIPYEESSSSSPLPSELRSEDAQRWKGSSFPLPNPVSNRPLTIGSNAVQSSPSSAKGNSMQAGPSLFHNGYDQKNSDVSESRPTKLRKRILDLEISPDKYIDTDYDQTSGSPDKGKKPASENGNMFLNYPGKTEFQVDAPRSVLNVSKSKGLVDLNEPLDAEERTTVSSVGFFGHVGSHRDVPYWDHSARLLSSSKDITQNPKKGSLSGTLNSLHDSRASGQDWFRHALESEQYKANMSNGKYGNQILPNHACQSPAFLTREHIKREPWKTKSVGITERPVPSYSMSNYNSAEHTPRFHASSRPGLFHPSDLGKFCDQSATYRENPNFLTQQSTSMTPSPFLSVVNFSTNSQFSASNNDPLRKWNLNSNPGAISGFVSEPLVRNGFCQSSSAGFDYANCNYGENTMPCRGNNFFKAISCNDPNPMNIALRKNDSSDNYINRQRVEILDNDCKPEEPAAVLPWLRGKGGGGNGSGSSSEVGVKAKMLEDSRKLFGVSIFGNSRMPKDPPDIHRQPGDEETECRKRKGLFDMNIPCEASDSELDNVSVDEVVIAEKKETKFESFNQFDLNSCITEEETVSGNVKVGAGIDLEALINLENEDVIRPIDDIDDVFIKSAASAIFDISSCVNSTQSSMEYLPPKPEGDDRLHWFVSIACATGNDVENDGLPEVLDDFEYMILRLKECTPEEYFPEPSIPDFLIPENNAYTVSTKTRKGRRGRQRRDFQRDILPGLITLSRHEITEDFQALGGPNRARKGRGRGRRLSVAATRALCDTDTGCALPLEQELQQLQQQQQHVHRNKVEAGVVDRSLTGWGKTTRRPRRQRCPAGNIAFPVTLT